jgi:hypothetical protein
MMPVVAQTHSRADAQSLHQSRFEEFDLSGVEHAVDLINLTCADRAK